MIGGIVPLTVASCGHPIENKSGIRPGGIPGLTPGLTFGNIHKDN
jgi:hypothetical protein